jgi:hypothetical protein
VALQPLFMLNSQFMDRRAQVLAEKITEDVGEDHGQQVTQAFLHVLGRKPNAQERERSLVFFEGEETAEAASRRLSMLCHALMNLNEFMYIP